VEVPFAEENEIPVRKDEVTYGNGKTVQCGRYYIVGEVEVNDGNNKL